MMLELFTIEELAERTGLSIRTIRFYISEGLLPPPQVRGRNAAYVQEALDRLVLIQRLKDAHLPLKEIRAQLDALTPERIHQLAEEQDQNLILKSTDASPTPPPVEPDSALNYITRVLDARSVYRAGESPQLFQLASPPSPQPEAQKGEPAERWRRITILPGVELHLREPIDPLIQKKLARIVEMIQILFQ